jgi:hypothetical protein
VVECLPSQLKAVSSNTSTTAEKQKQNIWNYRYLGVSARCIQPKSYQIQGFSWDPHLSLYPLFLPFDYCWRLPSCYWKTKSVRKLVIKGTYPQSSKKIKPGWALVAHTCSPSYLDWDWEDHCLRPAQTPPKNPQDIIQIIRQILWPNSNRRKG